MRALRLGQAPRVGERVPVVDREGIAGAGLEWGPPPPAVIRACQGPSFAFQDEFDGAGSRRPNFGAGDVTHVLQPMAGMVGAVQPTWWEAEDYQLPAREPPLPEPPPLLEKPEELPELLLSSLDFQKLSEWSSIPGSV